MSLVERENIGWSVPPEDPFALANAIQQGYANRDKLKVLAQNSRQKAPRYSRQYQAEEFIVVLQRAIDIYAN